MSRNHFTYWTSCWAQQAGAPTELFHQAVIQKKARHYRALSSRQISLQTTHAMHDTLIRRAAIFIEPAHFFLQAFGGFAT